MTTVVILQPSYLPWLGYFDQMRQADVFVHYDDVQFDKNGWRNRNQIKGQHGAAWLTVPVLHSGRLQQSLLDVEIDNRQPWQRKHTRTIAQFYSRAAFVNSFVPGLADIIDRPWSRLIDLNLALADWLAAQFGLSGARYRASSLAIAGDQSGRLLNICRHFGADRYLSGSAARAYLDVELFERNGIEVLWHDYVHPEYPQLHGPFVPYLSALDLLLNVGPESLSVLARPRAR
jgi:WbqC-like protein family